MSSAHDFFQCHVAALHRLDAGKQPSTLHPKALLNETAEIEYECEDCSFKSLIAT